MAHWNLFREYYDPNLTSLITYTSARGSPAQPTQPTNADADADDEPMLKLSDLIVDDYDADVVQSHQPAVGLEAQRLWTRKRGHQGGVKHRPHPSTRPSKLSSDSAPSPVSEYSSGSPSPVETHHRAPWMLSGHAFPYRGAEIPVSSLGHVHSYGSAHPGLSIVAGHHGYGRHGLPTPPYSPKISVPRSLPMQAPPTIQIPPDYYSQPSYHRLATPSPTILRHPPHAAPVGSSPTLLEEDAGSQFMRARLRIRPDQPVSLYAIPDTTDGSRPGTPLRDLIALAICGSENKMLSLRDIFQAIITRFRFYARAAHETGWKNSIRHALSLYSMFVHQPREGGDRGMGGYWRVSVGTGDEYVTRRNVAKASPPKHAQAEQGTPKKQTSRYEDDDSYDEGDTGGPQICPLSGVNHIDGKRKTRSATKAGRL